MLCVSAALVHKNLPRLLEAFAALGAGYEDCRLVLVGHGGLDSEHLREQITRLGLGERALLTGWLSDEDVEGLYGLAACCAYPSLYEGFGMPVLEAMARGVPLACSNATSLPEVAGDAAVLFDPLDTDAITAAVRRLLDDPEFAASLAERGRARADLFTWERCAEGVLAVYDELLAR